MTQSVIIVGAGPAGMFAAYELSKKDIDVLVLEKGKDVEDRTEFEIMSGIGGAGTFSDGTVNLRPDIGGDLKNYTHDEDKAWELVDYIKDVLKRHGMPEPKRENLEKEEELKRRAASVGARYLPIIQSHIGSDKAPDVIISFKKELEGRGIRFKVDTEIEDLIIDDDRCAGVRSKNGEEFTGEYTILAPGRVGIDWVQRLTEKYRLNASFAPIDIGVRVEVPSIIMDPVIDVNRDPKFHFYTKSYDDFVRTFCTNHQGFVVREEYDGFIGVNGHSRTDIQTENTNFAFLVKLKLTEPLEDTTEYGRALAQLATTIGGGKPIVQRIGDLKDGRRSTHGRLRRNSIQRTLDDVTPGDISMALPQRVMNDIMEGLDMLNEIIPGVKSSNTLLYAPEIKFYAKKLEVDEDMETSIPGLFAAGDGAGLSHDIVNAASTGVLAGRGISNKLN